MISKADSVLAGFRSVLRQSILRTGDIDKAVIIGEALGQLNWANNDGLLHEEPLEAALYDQHRTKITGAVQTVSTQPIEWLHVISRAHEIGGHTRLLRMLVDAQRRAGQRVAVAVTRSGKEALLRSLKEPSVVFHEIKGSPLQRVAKLVELGHSAKQVALHIHPDDLAAALAARHLALEGRRVLFVNHADHVFSYGAGAANVCLEVSGFGWRLTTARRMVREQHFLGIPITDAAAESPACAPAGPPGKIVFSMGNASKYRPTADYDFPAFASDLLDRSSDIAMEIVGPEPTDPHWSKPLARHGSRLRLLGRLPFEDTSARLSSAAAYVDSFPVTGGTAFPQALLSGRSVFGPSAHAGGYSLADALRYPTVSEMTNALVTFLRTGIRHSNEDQIRDRIKQQFNADATAQRLEAAAQGLLEIAPPELLSSPCTLDYHVNSWRAKGRVELVWRILRRRRLPFTFRERAALLRCAF